MRTITPERGFTAYPNGKRTHFPAGEPVPVSNEFAKILEGKGDLVAVEDEAEAEPATNKGRGQTPAADETGSAEATPTTDPEPAE